MSKLFILLLMIFFHIADDYYLQGILSQMKQKAWWSKNAPDKLYKNDYIAALAAHGFSWAFMIMLPIAIAQSFNVSIWFGVALIVNCIIHAIVDDLKANRHKTNLIADQIIHLLQIGFTFYIFVY